MIAPSSPGRASDAPVRDLHARAANDLLGRLRGSTPRRIAILKQDEGSERTTLETRFPRAPIESLDLARLDDPIAAPTHEPFDLIHSFRDLDWRPSLRRRLPALIQHLRVGGWLAALFPNDLYEPYREIGRMVAAEGPWAATLLPIAKTRPFNPTMEALYGLLSPLCASIDIWETTYLCRLASVEAIVDFALDGVVSPFLARIDPDARAVFLDRYRAELRIAYPTQPDGGVLMRAPRIFVLAER
jgi:trans-aconitate 2-methyltransferase